MIEELSWKADINDIEDIKLFFCHLHLDIGVLYHPEESFEVFINGKTEKRTFSDKAARQYDELMYKCHIICRQTGSNIFDTSCINFHETERWLVKNDEPIYELLVADDETGEIIYEAKYKSEVPKIFILYKCETDQKVGYGVMKTETTFKLFDNELKRGFVGFLNQSVIWINESSSKFSQN